MDDAPFPQRLMILESKMVLDVACGDKFMVVIAAESNFKGQNLNLRNFQTQNFMLMSSKWQNLINFSHKKAVFINNLENNLRDSSPLDPQNIKKMKSLKLSNQKSEVMKTNQKFENEEKNFVSKKELVQKSQNLIMDLDIAQKEITKTETKSYAQGFSPHDHKGEHQHQHHHNKNVSNHTKISENDTLREIKEEEVTDHDIPDLQSMTLKRNTNEFKL